MELEILDKSGSQTGKKVELPDSVFGIEPNDHAIYLDVKQFLANKRQGTHKTKERAEIVGSTKKIKKQKGTGTARAGSIKSPIFRGGGRVFGPKPRDYSFKLNKKLKRLARKSALAYKAKESSIAILEDFTMEAPKTKECLAILNSLSLQNKKVLFVLPESDKSIYLSARNLPKAKVTTVSNLNTYDIVNAEHLLVFENSVEKFSKF